MGQTAEYNRTITEEDIVKFAEVSGDHNPVHMDEDYAKKTIFKGRIAHGMLSASFISTVLASKLPGPGTIYLKQELQFTRPVRIGDTITTKVEVLSKDSDKNHIELRTYCLNQKGKMVIEGKALVMLKE
ncbi:MAG: MaoC family dehydratase [Candidatus Hodarchaeales archaeon]